MYAIICDARTGQDLGVEKLALVDRAKTKKFWWTSDCLDLIKTWDNQDEARAATKSLRQNKPIVVSYEEAKTIIQRQASNIRSNRQSLYEAARHGNMGADLGWDAHKSAG